MTETAATAAPGEPGYAIGRALFVRGLGLVYLCAFVSLGVQIDGLIGSDGILPAFRFVDALHQYPGGSAVWPAPTLFWFGASDTGLAAAWIAGALVSLAVLAGGIPAPGLALAFVLYRSLASVGQTFLGFQWDTLLLEAGFLGIFFAPFALRLSAANAQPSPMMRWLVWWLAFRLFFFSGFVKLASGDPTWWHLEALGFHWWTQPLPPFTAWWAARLPDVLDRFGVAATLAIELFLPWLIPFGRAPRLVACGGFLFLMAMIAATGNYGFFNLLAAVICLPLVDDASWRRILRRGAAPGAAPRRPLPVLQRILVAGVAAFLLATSIPISLAQARLVGAFPDPISDLADVAGRTGLVSSYGLFARMTTTRPEIVIEGSRDGVRFEPYLFRWKPGPLDRRPAFTGPHMPRLDWQMWFAALGPPERSPWLFSLMRHLLLGTPAVVGLLAHDPFPDGPPIAVRARLYEYRFSDGAQRAATGAYWTRTPAGEFVAELRLTTHGGEIRP